LIKAAIPFKPFCGFCSYPLACCGAAVAKKWREKYTIKIDGVNPNPSEFILNDMIALGFQGSNPHSMNDGTAVASWLKLDRPFNPLTDFKHYYGLNCFYSDIWHK
jgi:hypothetical protein